MNIATLPRLVTAVAAFALSACAGLDDPGEHERPTEPEGPAELSLPLFPEDNATPIINAHTPGFRHPEGDNLVLPSELCLDVVGASSSAESPVQVWTCHGGSNQQWAFDPDVGLIVGLGSGLCLEVSEDDPTRVQIDHCTYATNQLWTYTNASNGLYNWATESCLDVVNHGTSPGTPVQMYSCHGGYNQMWRPGSTIVRSVASGRCLDMGLSNGQSTGVAQIWDCHGNANQRWYRSGWDTLANDFNRHCLTTVGGATHNGALVEVSPYCSYSFYAEFSFRSDGSLYHRQSGRCLDVIDDNRQNGARLMIHDCHGGPNQTWALR